MDQLYNCKNLKQKTIKNIIASNKWEFDSYLHCYKHIFDFIDVLDIRDILPHFINGVSIDIMEVKWGRGENLFFFEMFSYRNSCLIITYFLTNSPAKCNLPIFLDSLLRDTIVNIRALSKAKPKKMSMFLFNLQCMDVINTIEIGKNCSHPF